MTSDEFRVLAKGMKAVYPNPSFLPDMDAVNVWYELLKDIDYKVANMAIQMHAQSNKFPPTVAEIRDASAKLIHGEIKDWSKAWEEACRAMSRFGIDRKAEAYEKLDDLTKQVVDRLGYRNLCMSENIAVDRANFRSIYETLANRQTETSKLSPQIQQMLSGGQKLLKEI